MKYFKTILIAVLSITVITLSSFAIEKNQSNSNENYLIMRTVNVQGTWPSQIIISNETGEIETIPLKDLKGKAFTENLTTIHNKLNEIKKNGYKLVSSTGGNGNHMIVSTYIFEKE